MPISAKRLTLAAALAVWPLVAAAAEPVRTVPIYVEPFYRSAAAPEGTPQVAVGSQFNALLASNKREDILAARDLIEAKPNLITPMTLMVLAIRFYDVGLRDDAVFWFYVAKERYIVMSEVLDVKTPQLAQADDAVRSFSSLAGPVINGYAFCDLAKQQELHAKAVAWVESHPYEVMLMAPAPALPGDRAANHKRAIANAKERAAKERAYFADAKTVEAFYATRKRNEADVKFCWK
ncbi:MAG TPA: hypothetical protein VFW22_02540 [Pseudolabrys sp.]|nr:hypothetical protein [Pseudolabrys sp.]